MSWTTARTAAGISCRFHDLRHTAVTRLLEAGQPFAVVAEIMGWSPATSVRMAKRYGHIGDSVRRQAMTALETRKPATNTETTDSALALRRSQRRFNEGDYRSPPQRQTGPTTNKTAKSFVWNWLLGLDSNQQPSG